MLQFIPRPLRRVARRWIEARGFVLASRVAVNLQTVMGRRHLPHIETVIDVGASDGRWSQDVMKYYPSARYLLIEAQRATHGAMLSQFQARHKNVVCELCAAGNKSGETNFD